MEEKKNFAFFAAANGYSGFRSYFDEVFNPAEYTKIYILKGGPGTGKSTLMKRVYSHFEKAAQHSEKIYCSSDPASLDGIILNNGNARIAVIDGTAPHERDTLFPGAADELINLGEGWDRRWLEGARDKIISLANEKRSAYKTAYSYLSLAGEAHRKSEALCKFRFDEKIVKNRVKSLAETLTKSEKPTVSTRLISAFGKDGAVKFSTLKDISSRYIGLSGDARAASHFLSLLLGETKGASSVIRFPSPLDDRLCEALHFPDDRLTVAIDNAGDEVIALADFYAFDPLDNERGRVFNEAEVSCHSEAKRWFKIASDLHFRLEEIYSTAMDFAKNDEVLSRLIDSISEKMLS